MEALVKAKNISGRALCLTSGVVQPGDIIEVTPAELSTLTDFLDPAPAVQKKADQGTKEKYEAPTVESKPLTPEVEAKVKGAK